MFALFILSVPLFRHTHTDTHRHWFEVHRNVRDDGVTRFLWKCIFAVRKLIIVTASHIHAHTHTHSNTNRLILDNFQSSLQLKIDSVDRAAYVLSSLSPSYGSLSYSHSVLVRLSESVINLSAPPQFLLVLPPTCASNSLSIYCRQSLFHVNPLSTVETKQMCVSEPDGVIPML